ncbi:uncharacterized protein LOC129745485 [Uranotaenia lowii]|uniref:uncharacterized protein LOC129745485 n=1 Tax=Uranotaenia lowii TaxID=190385 RepID=UPI0024783B45|nr:uncharacterized protein LOC129745485 [Uranotaenia lowii]
MMWVFHVLWLIMVLVLFFMILRRIYYFGMQGSEQQDIENHQIGDNRQYYIFTVYGAAQPDPTARPSQVELPPPNYEAALPPPKYEEVIKSPEIYQKPPPVYSQV